MIALRTLALGTTLIACGQDPARVSLVPLDLGECGRPANANQLSITAFGESGETKKAVPLDRTIEIADFPDDTVQLGVEVLVGGGDSGASGKTMPLDFADLPDGTAIPILMVPPGGFCPVGPLLEARKRPLIARAGTFVLVVGGEGAVGPLSTAELYDPATATFSPVDIPEALRDDTNGLSGAVLATLPDGKVALSGGPRGLLAVFDPETKTFGSSFAISPQRAFHGAVATGAGLLVAGGCQGVDTGGCNAIPLRSTTEYALDGTTIASGPNLAIDAISEGGQLIDTGNAFVLAGGFGTAGEGHRFGLADRDAVKLTGLGGQAALLDGGGVMTAFAPDGGAASGTAMVVVPGGATAPSTAGPPLAGVRLVALEDGRLVGIGGDTGVDAGGVARVIDYEPTTDSWTLRAPTASPSPGAPAGRPEDQPPPLDQPSAIRLADGGVLVLGGEADPSTSVWVYRPSLIGPTSGSIAATPASTSIGVLTPTDPTAVDRVDGWVLTATDDALTARALVGGPRLIRGSVKATVNVVAGGFALIAQQTAPDRALIAHLIPGEPLRIEAAGTTVCTGDPVTFSGSVVTAILEVGDGITVRIDDQVVLTCDHAATAAGSWGLAPDGSGAAISVAAVTVAR